MLVADAAVRAERLQPRLRELERLAESVDSAPPFAAALRREEVAVIAEVKRRSPSKGDINPGLSVVDQAAAYRDGGAAALSILTEPTRFGGCDEDLVATRAAVALPVLKKDFHVDPAQIVEARALGASAVLLIARALPPVTLRTLAALGAELGLDVLIEIRDERELDVALSTDAPIIGVNNRDLETLAIDLATGDRLVPLVPADRIAVFESGVNELADVTRAADAGADAVLVGSSVSAAANPAAAVRALGGVTRRPREPRLTAGMPGR